MRKIRTFTDIVIPNVNSALREHKNFN